MKASKLIIGLVMGSGLLATLPVFAADGLKPFLAAPAQTGAIKDVSEQMKGKLKEAGFVVVADFAPSGKSRVLAVTSDALKKSAAKGERSAYGVTMRVSLAEKDGKVSVSCTNPQYFSAAYHMGNNVADVKKGLETAVGCNEPFGAGDMSAEDIAGYHYTIGMEYLDDVYTLGEFASFDDAKKAVEAGLESNKSGVKKVYRVEIPGKNQVVYGVLLNTKASNKDADDGFIMGVLDQGDKNRLGYLPYEILVNNNKVEALHMRYRAAVHFPQLPMLGDGPSFFKLQASPDAIGEVLTGVVAPKPAQ
jgi:hypothetical protein